MIIRKSLFFSLFLLCAIQSFCAIPLDQQFKQAGYVEMYDKDHGTATFNILYAYFDELIEFLQTNPEWAQKLYIAKERFLRSRERNYYATDFFGFYDESKRDERGQISFYYSTHFHEFICSHYKELMAIAQITRFFNACFEIQKKYGNLFEQAAAQLGLATIFSCKYGQPPILFKVVKYLPSYVAAKPHYDGSVFSLFLDSTDNQSLLLAAYKPSLTVDDFIASVRTFDRAHNHNSIVLIPGALLAEFFIFPTPHIVVQTGKTRYATIAFAMRPDYSSGKNEFTSLPNFHH